MELTTEQIAFVAYAFSSGIKLRDKRTHELFAPTALRSDGRIELSNAKRDRPVIVCTGDLENEYTPLFPPQV